MKKEYWLPVAGYIGLYEVSNLGRVKSLERVVMRKNGRVQHVPEKILKPQTDKGGYLTVGLCKDGKMKKFQVHRLVAEAFLENPENLPCVNHRNEVKTDNRVENLEWCSHEYNLNYGTHNERMAAALAKQVAQISRETGEVIRIWPSTRECSRQTGFRQGSISQCALGKPHYKTAYGFKWSYVN